MGVASGVQNLQRDFDLAIFTLILGSLSEKEKALNRIKDLLELKDASDS
jgi:hypothetical protein